MINDDANPFDEGFSGQPEESTTLGCSMKVLAFLATFFGWIGGLIIFFLEKQSTYIRQVAMQTVLLDAVIFFFEFVFFLLLFCDHWFTYTLFVLYTLFWLAVKIFLVVMAILRTETNVAFLIPGISIAVNYIESRF